VKKGSAIERCSARDFEDARADADRLNAQCACDTVDREALAAALVDQIGDAATVRALLAARPNLFAQSAAFVSQADFARMRAVIAAVEAAARLPGYREAALSAADAVARRDFGPLGVFMGYDFHVGADGPKLIEVNTNAGGAYLNAELRRAQRGCIERDSAAGGADAFHAGVSAMFQSEWRRQRGAGAPRRVAIVDDAPGEQYLYPEFLLARGRFEKAGVEAIVVDAVELEYANGALRAAGRQVDLVYNRLVDFSLALPAHRALRDAYEAGAVVVTPNPHRHALLADKRNLVTLGDATSLAAFGLADGHLRALEGMLPAAALDKSNADRLWSERRNYVFKPAAGYGARAVYRGDKITSKVWSGIQDAGYVAQAVAPPGRRRITSQNGVEDLKMDVRIYAYDGRPLLAAARLYQGQTTNFRTRGGGFAPVHIV
jgi:hypothetical protein